MYVNYRPQSWHPVSLLWAVLPQDSRGRLAYSTRGLGLLIDSLATYSLSQGSQKCQIRGREENNVCVGGR